MNLQTLEELEIRAVTKARPKDATGREIVSVRRLLEWAFATECATLDFDEVGAIGGGGWPSISATAGVCDAMSLNPEPTERPGACVRVDHSRGCSATHDDAEAIATILRNAVPFHLALRMAELARACQVPCWDLGPQYLRPKEWGKRTRHGQHGKPEVCRVVEYILRGRRRRREEMWVPCTWVPCASQIAAARRAYLDWWGGLLAVSAGLRGVELSCYALSDHMPPMTPWQKNC